MADICIPLWVCPRSAPRVFLSSSKKRAYRPRGKVLLGQFGHAGFISDVEIPRFGYFPGAERAPRQHNEEMYKKVSTNSVQQSDATSR